MAKCIHLHFINSKPKTVAIYFINEHCSFFYLKFKTGKSQENRQENVSYHIQRPKSKTMAVWVNKWNAINWLLCRSDFMHCILSGCNLINKAIPETSFAASLKNIVGYIKSYWQWLITHPEWTTMAKYTLYSSRQLNNTAAGKENFPQRTASKNVSCPEQN